MLTACNSWGVRSVPLNKPNFSPPIYISSDNSGTNSITN